MCMYIYICIYCFYHQQRQQHQQLTILQGLSHLVINQATDSIIAGGFIATNQPNQVFLRLRQITTWTWQENFVEVSVLCNWLRWNLKKEINCDMNVISGRVLPS